MIYPNTLVFNNPDCMQGELSDIEISGCYVDTTNRYIWIEIYNTASYAATTKSLIIRTRNFGILNPDANIVSAFTVKCYTWTTSVAPTLDPSNDDYVIVK